MAKNKVNAVVIMRSVESYADGLLSTSIPNTPTDCLAYVHALLLYQIIRFFDGNIQSRTSAERAIPTLELAALCLEPHVDLTDPSLSVPVAGDLRLAPVRSLKKCWKDWQFQESARRTLLFTGFFLQVYRMLSLNQILPCEPDQQVVYKWTMSAHLWLAKTHVDFATAWTERRHFYVYNVGFADVMAHATSDDVDAFGLIMLTSILGLDECSAWLTRQGGLRQHVLRG
jgi:hypothetical protein